MRQRSNLIILFGVVFFIIGGAIVFLVLNDDDDGGGGSSSGSALAADVTVLVAAADIPSGTTSAQAINDGLLTTEVLKAGTQPAGAVTGAGQIDNQLFAVSVAEGDVITTAQLVVRSLSNIEVPEGFEGVAVAIDATSGGAGYIAPGDRINIYGVFGIGDGSAGIATASALGTNAGGIGDLPKTELVLTNVLVLDVSAQATTSFQSSEVTPRAGPPTDLVFLLALKPQDAERAIQLTRFGSFYFSRPAEGSLPTPDTEGVNGRTVDGPVSAASAEPQG